MSQGSGSFRSAGRRFSGRSYEFCLDVNPTLTRPGCVHGTGWDILWATFWRQSSQHRTRRVIGERAGCRGDRRLGSLPGIAKEGGLGASVNKIRMWKEIRFAGDGEGGREERRRTAEAANVRGARLIRGALVESLPPSAGGGGPPSTLHRAILPGPGRSGSAGGGVRILVQMHGEATGSPSGARTRCGSPGS